MILAICGLRIYGPRDDCRSDTRMASSRDHRVEWDGFGMNLIAGPVNCSMDEVVAVVRFPGAPVVVDDHYDVGNDYDSDSDYCADLMAEWVSDEWFPLVLRRNNVLSPFECRIQSFLFRDESYNN